MPKKSQNDVGLGREAPGCDGVESLADEIPGAAYRRLPDALGGGTQLLSAGIGVLSGFPRRDFFAEPPRTLMSIVHADDRRKVSDAIVDPVDGRFDVDYRLVRADGSVRWVHDQGRVIRDTQGRICCLAGVILDISRRRRAELADATRNAAIARQQAAVVSLATSDSVARGRLVEACGLCTEAVVRAAGVARASVWLLSDDRQQLELVDLYNAEDDTHNHEAMLNAEDYPAYFRAMRTGRVVDANDAQTDPRTCDFTEIYLKPLGITAMLDAALRVGGEVVGVVCLEHTHTARAWQPHEIQFAGEVADQVSHTLLNRGRRVAQERHEKLQEQFFQAQKLEAVGRLAGGVAHDFNNLLTVITANAEIMQSMDVSREERALCIAEILATSERAAELSKQLLTFSRKESTEVHAVDVVAVAVGMRRMLRQLVGSSATLSVRVPTGPLWVTATDSLLQQVLSNLVVNARDATDEQGAVSLVIEQMAESGGSPPGRYVSVQVSDDGSGMSPMLQSRIFEPFFTTKNQGKGTGLGLSTVYGIVERCGGTISVQSELGQGATFTVLLPVHAAMGEPVAEIAPAPHAPVGDGRTLVFVEDNEPLRRAVTVLLKNMGFVVQCAPNADQAILLLQRIVADGADLPALILSDVVMPGGGGPEVHKWATQHLPGVPVAFISGYVSEETERLTRTVPRLDKPFASAELRAFVMGLVG